MADRTGFRVLAVTVVVVVAVVALVVVATSRRGGPEPRAEVAAGTSAYVPDGVSIPDVVASLEVLRDWDRARRLAWATGDRVRLGRLYAESAPAGRRDVAMLDRWTARGLTVSGMAMQVLGVELRARTDRSLVLVVTDRLVGAVAVAEDGRRWRLPRDGATTRRLAFRRTSGRWVLVRVSPA